MTMTTFTARYYGRDRTCTLIGHVGKRVRKKVGYTFLDNGGRRYLIEGGVNFDNPKQWGTFKPCSKEGEQRFAELVKPKISWMQHKLDHRQKDADRRKIELAELKIQCVTATTDWTKTGGTRTIYERDDYGYDTDVIDRVLNLWHRYTTEPCQHDCSGAPKGLHYQRGDATDEWEAQYNTPMGWSWNCLHDEQRLINGALLDVKHYTGEIERLKSLIGGK